MIPNNLIEALTVALAHWDGRGPTPDDDYVAGKEMASAIMELLVWNSNQPQLEAVDVELLLQELAARWEGDEVAIAERLIREYGDTIPYKQLVEEIGFAVAIHRRQHKQQ